MKYATDDFFQDITQLTFERFSKFELYLNLATHNNGISTADKISQIANELSADNLEYSKNLLHLCVQSMLNALNFNSIALACLLKTNTDLSESNLKRVASEIDKDFSETETQNLCFELKKKLISNYTHTLEKATEATLLVEKI